MEKLDELLRNGVSRRTFLAGAGAGAGSLAVATLAAGCGSGKSVVPTTPAATLSPGQVTDENILNFALNLEYLEATFYQFAVTGAGLSAANMGSSPGAVTGGAQVSFATPAIAAYAAEIANDELLHVEFLRSALGSAAVAMPAIDFTDAFTGLATAVNTAFPTSPFPMPIPFNPFADEASFLVGAFVFEDVGVTAYHGAAASISTPAYLTAAAGIMAVEGYHAAEVRTILTFLGDPYLTWANGISAIRAAVTTADGGPGSGDEVAVSGSTIAPTDTNSLAFSRTTDQVLHIVYLAPAAGVTKSGGFFPSGLNGAISASTT